MVDYYSRFIEIVKLMTTTATSVISHLKSIFSHHGIPEYITSDNGPQFSAAMFQKNMDSNMLQVVRDTHKLQKEL